jgi:hypothetical protein
LFTNSSIDKNIKNFGFNVIQIQFFHFMSEFSIIYYFVYNLVATFYIYKFVIIKFFYI